MTAPAKIRQSDLTRALRAIKAAEIEGANIRIDPDGTMHIIIGPAPADSQPANPLDRVLKDAA